MSALNSKLAAIIMEAIEANRLKLPTLPEIAVNIMRCERDPNLDVMELARTIEVDPATSAQILRIANSPLLRREVKVGDLSKAVSLLGISYSAKLAVSFATKQLFNSNNAQLNHLVRQTWGYSMKVACHCYVLARQGKLLQEEAFLSGLLHQIGALPVITVAEHHDIEDLEELKRTIQELHPMLGEQILAHWHFPHDIADIPINYQDPNRYIDRLDYCDLVTISNNYLRDASEQIPWQDVSALNRLGWHAPQVEEKFAELQDEIELAYEIFNG